MCVLGGGARAKRGAPERARACYAMLLYRYAGNLMYLPPG